MPSLEDVKVFARQHGDLDSDALEARIAREFEMSREEAARMLTGLGSELEASTGDSPIRTGDPTATEPAAPVVVGAGGSSGGAGVAVPAAAVLGAPNVMGSSPGNANPAAAPLAAQELERERDEDAREEEE